MRLGLAALRGSNPRSSAVTSSFARALRLGGLLVSALRGRCVAIAAIRPPGYLIATRRRAGLPCPQSGPARPGSQPAGRDVGPPRRARDLSRARQGSNLGHQPDERHEPQLADPLRGQPAGYLSRSAGQADARAPGRAPPRRRPDRHRQAHRPRGRRPDRRRSKLARARTPDPQSRITLRDRRPGLRHRQRAAAARGPPRHVCHRGGGQPGRHRLAAGSGGAAVRIWSVAGLSRDACGRGIRSGLIRRPSRRCGRADRHGQGPGVLPDRAPAEPARRVRIPRADGVVELVSRHDLPGPGAVRRPEQVCGGSAPGTLLSPGGPAVLLANLLCNPSGTVRISMICRESVVQPARLAGGRVCCRVRGRPAGAPAAAGRLEQPGWG